MFLNKNNIIETPIDEILTDNFMPYSAYVITERALPSIDGFKPSQRRILETMRRVGLLSGVRKKSQGVVGSTMYLHPHGDGAIYEALVRMSNDAECLTLPYIDSKGNFGKQYSREMQYASARYTEVRLNPIAKELFGDINKNAVPMKPNYDNTTQEPTLLPVSFPTILANPVIGTAVGMSSSIPPFNLGEIIDYTVNFIKSPKTVKPLDYIKAPDFSTGAEVIFDKDSYEKIYDTGLGSFQLRATYECLPKENSIHFKQLPYNTTYEAVIDKISELTQKGKIKEVVDVDDNYGLGTEGIIVRAKRGTDLESLAQKLLKLTSLTSTFSCDFKILVDGRPKTLGIEGIIRNWISFRVGVIKNVVSYELKQEEKQLELLLGIEKVLLDLDKAIEIVRNSDSDKESVEDIMSYFEVNEEQAEYISAIKLINMNKNYLLKKVGEIKTLISSIEDKTSFLQDKKRIAMHIINQLEKIKKNYPAPRKTHVISSDDVLEFKETLEVEKYSSTVFLTKDGYIKKLPHSSQRGNFVNKLKDGDEILEQLESENDGELLVFTNQHNVHKIRISDIPDHKPSQIGTYIESEIELDKNEEVLYTLITKDFSENLIIGFEDGKIARIALSAYETKQNRKKLQNAYANKRGILFKKITDNIDILAVSDIKKATLFNTSMINVKNSKTAQGNQVQKSKDDSKTVAYHIVNGEDYEYYRVKSAGVGKYLRKEDDI